MQQTGQNWLGLGEAPAVFESAWYAAAAMVPEGPQKAPSERQIDNLLASGLPATELESGRRTLAGAPRDGDRALGRPVAATSGVQREWCRGADESRLG